MATQCQLGITLWSTDVFALADFLQQVAGLEMHQRHPGFAALRAGEAAVTVHDDESYRGHRGSRHSREKASPAGSAPNSGSRSIPSPIHSHWHASSAANQSRPFGAETATLECQVMAPDGYVLSLWQLWNPSTSA